MREIKFRGIAATTGNWEYGFYTVEGGYEIIRRTDSVPNGEGTPIIIKRGTGSQFTGLKDKNGVEIYEGDVVIREIFTRGAYNEDFIGEVKMNEGRWWIDNGRDAVPLWTEIEELSILGNIHEHPQLLEKRREN